MEDPNRRFDMPAMSAQIRAPFDVRCPDMIQYLLTEDKLDSLEGGAEALDFTFFGAFLAIALTLAGIAIPLYVADQRGYIFLACIGLAPLFFLPSIYFFVNGWKKRRDAKENDS